MEPKRWEQIERLYHAALEREPEAREQYLEEACAGDGDLRREVAELLDSDDPNDSFFQTPAIEIAAKALANESPSQLQTGAQTDPPRSIGAYQLLEPLGRGGMGEVYLAHDSRLGRKVAVKLLPAKFAADSGRVRRFAQEARAASALNHPNIITIHEIGEVATETANTPYIVTEYVEGETLRQQMTNAPQRRINPSDAIEIASQIAAALAAAHEAGIVHRDIKPENIMVRRDRLVKVLDFGLAKLSELQIADCGLRIAEKENLSVYDRDNPQSAIRNPQSTEPGVVMGTPRYMSPEQASGEKMDARTDLFSLGVILYEMIAGQPPFVGATTSDLISAILKDEPPLLVDQSPGTPPEIQQIISKALRKDRGGRYQNANELLADLKEFKQRLEFQTKMSGPRSETQASGGELPRSGPNSTRRRAAAMAIGVVAVIASLTGWFSLNRRPALTEKDTVLLADFENRTGEEIFDKMLKQGLAIQLQQSPFLTLFPEAQMRHELKLMKLSPNERVTAEIGREICERQNLKALISGSIASLGAHYVITLEAINGQNGEPLAREQVESESKEQVLRTLSQAATQLRGRLGESLSSIQRFNRSLQESTTARPEAFKVYSQALELAVTGRMMEAIPTFHRAVELDPDFAMAHSHLAILNWVDRPRLAAEYAQKSYDLKDRVGEIERLRLTHIYHRIVTGNLNKANETLQLQRRTYPREWTGPQDLALNYHLLGQSEQAIAEARESIRLNPNFAVPYRTQAVALLRLNRFQEAIDVLAQAAQQGLDHPDFHGFLYQIAYINNDLAGIREQIEWARGRPNEYVALDWQTGAAAFAGKWREAQELSRRAIDLAIRSDKQEVAARYTTEQALRGSVFGDCRQARAYAAQGLKLSRQRPTLARAALALALCGETNQAISLANELEKRYPEDTLIHSIWLPSIRAAVGFQRGDSTQTIEQLQTASRHEAAAEFWPQYLRGLTFLKLKGGAEAAAEFQKILDHRGYAPLSPLYPLALLGLARATTLTGETAKSQQAYQDFFAAWKEADADPPILIEAKKTYERR